MTNNTTECKKGFIKRVSYETKKGVQVPEVCIKDLGKPGKGPKLFPPLTKGTLTKHGYSSDDKKEDRHNALIKAALDYGKNDVIRKLNAVSILVRNTNPKKSEIFHKDMLFVQKL